MTTKDKPRTDVTLSRLVATALAAVTAAFLGSRLGTAGTIIGAGVASVVSTVAAALYQHSLDRTSTRVRSRVAQARGQESESQGQPVRWRMAAAITAGAFVLGMGGITGYELLSHGPVSGGNNGTTIGSLFGQPTQHRNPVPPARPHPHPTTSSTPAPTTSSTPSPTPSPPTTTTTVPPTTTTAPPLSVSVQPS